MIFINEEQRFNNGVYVIENVINNKKYVGSTFTKDQKGFKKRFDSYTKQVNSYYNKKLTNALKKYGRENFIFRIVEIVNTSLIECRSREEYYIEFFDTVNSGYNMKVQGVGGNGGANKGKKYPKPSKEVVLRRAIGCSKAKKGMKFSESHKLAIKNARLIPDYWGKKYVFIKNIHTNDVLMFRSRTEAGQTLNRCMTQIWSLLNGKSKLLCDTFVKCTDEEIREFLAENYDLLDFSKIRY